MKKKTWNKDVPSNFIYGFIINAVFVCGIKGFGDILKIKISHLNKLTHWQRYYLFLKLFSFMDNEPGGALQADRIRESILDVSFKLVPFQD